MWVPIKGEHLFDAGCLLQISQRKMSAHLNTRQEDTAPNKRGWLVKDLPFSVLNKICLKLNALSPFFDDFRMVAEKLGSDKDTIQCIGQKDNPTYQIFMSCHRDVKVGKLLAILQDIGRTDAAKVLEDWIAEP